MTIQEMHYDFKLKLNKIDSQQYRNLRVPEIDWILNEAQEIFIKNVAFPRVYNHLGFETSQRTIDDIRTIVVENVKLVEQSPSINPNEKVFSLPSNYLFFVSAKVKLRNPQCGVKEGILIVRQHDDRFEQSPFDKSSYEWGEVNATFDDKGLRVYTDGSFTIEELLINYIRIPAYIHNAQDFSPSQSYVMLNGTTLTGRQNSELPINTHREIVDIAVMIASNNMDNPNIQLKQSKVSLNQIN